jgi:hypothetical protein
MKLKPCPSRKFMAGHFAVICTSKCPVEVNLAIRSAVTAVASPRCLQSLTANRLLQGTQEVLAFGSHLALRPEGNGKGSDVAGAAREIQYFRVHLLEPAH